MISIVLPCYNPARGWRQLLIQSMQELHAKLPDETIQYIISNDGSTSIEKDELTLLTALSNVIFLDHKINEGKGSAIRKGADIAQGEFIIYTDLDFPFGTDPVVDILTIFRQNPDCHFVYGNRNNEYFRMLPLKRRILSRSLHWINRIFSFSQITDSQAGIKGLRQSVKSEILDTKTNSFVFEIELIRNLIRKKIVIEKIEVLVNPSTIFSDFGSRVIFRELLSLALIRIRN